MLIFGRERGPVALWLSGIDSWQVSISLRQVFNLGYQFRDSKGFGNNVILYIPSISTRTYTS